MDCGGQILDTSVINIMGVLNVTPDSFSDGGSYFSSGKLDESLALSRAAQMFAEGASIIDVGGESTRPGAATVSPAEELDRVLPVIEKIAAELPVIVSVDTSTPEVMTAAAKAGAGLLNDVRALQRPGALSAAAQTRLPVCLMHMQGQPGTMQNSPSYEDVLVEVCKFLEGRIKACEAASIPRTNIIVDPGFGFGKSLEHNLALLRHLRQLQNLGRPVLAGLSRKAMIGKLLGDDSLDRTTASVCLAVLAVERGASIVRVHDVLETARAMRMVSALRGTSG
ncbi:MAG: dihydropteroate synthase [Halieaceae bacterium]|jgi:dihydropteroate synthase